MLTFKKKFLDAIRCGQKTQTLRLWKYARVRSGQKDFIPGVGPIMIDLVEEVSLESLTDADAIPDGFPTIAALRSELYEIYGNPLVGKLYRIRFHLSETPQEVPQEVPQVPPPVPHQEGLSLHSFGRTYLDENQKSAPRVFLTTEEVVERLVNRCRVYRNICDWNHEPGKSKDFFALFKKSPRGSNGVPILEGRKLWRLIKEHASPEEWDSISWIASEVCRAWTEWQYAVEKWNNTDDSCDKIDSEPY